MAVVFNGTNQGINCGLSAAILSSAGSIFTYMEIIPSRSVDETYLGLNMRSDSMRSVEIAGIAGGQTFQVLIDSGGGTLSSQATNSIKNGSLHRLFIAWSQQSGRRFCYLDGAQVSEVFFSIPSPYVVANGETTLGYRNWAGDQRWYQGQMANVAVWTGTHFGNQAAENAAAAALTGATAQVSDFADFAAYWPLDYDARDLGPNSLNGTLVGTPTFTETPPRWYREDGTAFRPYLKTSGGIVPLE
jgi:hypothetical protein